MKASCLLTSSLLVSDAGFVMKLRNRPTRVEHCPTLGAVCDAEHAVHLHTSTTHEKYVLAIDSNGKIFKDTTNFDESNPTLIENTINVTRKLRMPDEMIHASLRNGYKLLNEKKIKNTYTEPYSKTDIKRYHLRESHKNIPKISVMAVVCVSLLNETHKGYQPLFMNDNQQVILASNVLHRLFLKNPLLHPEIWPHRFDRNLGGWPWSKTTFRNLMQGPDVIGFPKLNSADEVNAKATVLTGGIHALRQTNSGTFCSQ